MSMEEPVRPCSDWNYNVEVTTEFETKKIRISVDWRLYGKIYGFWLTLETLVDLVKRADSMIKGEMEMGEIRLQDPIAPLPVISKGKAFVELKSFPGDLTVKETAPDSTA